MVEKGEAKIEYNVGIGLHRPKYKIQKYKKYKLRIQATYTVLRKMRYQWVLPGAAFRRKLRPASGSLRKQIALHFKLEFPDPSWLISQ